MSLRQSILDRVRFLNKRFTNRLLIRFAGGRKQPFAILTHTGRRTGTPYRIPVIVEPLGEHFVIALTYGKKVDWYRNVVARRGCSVTWKGRKYALTDPLLLEPAAALPAFPRWIRLALRWNRITGFLRLSRVTP